MHLDASQCIASSIFYITVHGYFFFSQNKQSNKSELFVILESPFDKFRVLFINLTATDSVYKAATSICVTHQVHNIKKEKYKSVCSALQLCCNPLMPLEHRSLIQCGLTLLHTPLSELDVKVDGINSA